MEGVYQENYLNIIGNKRIKINTNHLVSNWFWFLRRSDVGERNEWNNYSNWEYEDIPNVLPISNNMNNKNKILLVEDAPNLGAVLKNYLELSGFDVLLKSDGKKGWSTFKTGSFDLCILDVMMPEMDGLTLAKEIRKVNEDIPLIFLTARSQKKDVVIGYESGADDYITKPFDSELLIHKINALLRLSLIHI